MSFRKIAPPIVLSLALAACQQPAAPSDDSVQPTESPPSQTTAAPSSLWNNGQAKALDIQVAHPNGAVLQLTSLQTRPSETVVGMRVINGRDKDIDLNRFNNNRDGYLLLDTGERLYLSPPATNTRVTIPAGQTFEGELVFLGRMPAVKNAVLVLNENSSGDNQYTSTPGFRIDLPLSSEMQGVAE